MKTDGLFTLHHVEIPFKKYGEPIHILPFGDVHYGAPLHCSEHWQEFIDNAKRLKNVWLLGIGDYMDVISTSERRIIKGGLHDSTEASLDKWVRHQADEFINTLKPFKGKFIGLCGGNHYYDFTSGSTSDNYICEQLGAKYLGAKTLIHVTFRDTANGGHHGHSLVISVHHGEPGGRMPGSSSNKLYHMANGFDADIQLMGHDHNKCADFINRLGVNYSNGSLKEYNRKILLARTGGFLKGYVSGQKSYICDANLPPNDLGALTISIIPMCSKIRKGGKFVSESRWLDIKATI